MPRSFKRLLQASQSKFCTQSLLPSAVLPTCLAHLFLEFMKVQIVEFVIISFLRSLVALFLLGRNIQQLRDELTSSFEFRDGSYSMYSCVNCYE